MPSDSSTARSDVPRAAMPLTTAARQRLQKVFEHAQRCAEKKDFDYANQLFTQCVTEDPSNLVYLQSFLTNLRAKYGDNKKGSKLGALRLKNQRSAIAKAAGKGDWEGAFRTGFAALVLNPWDVGTLVSLAGVMGQLKFDEARLSLLKTALDVDSKHVEANRQAGLTLERMGQFDQAIACWRRVEQAKPHDDEALRAISQLSVEKTIHEGGYDPAMIAAGGDGASASKTSVASYAKGMRPIDPNTVDSEEDAQQHSTHGERLQAAIAADPTNRENYLALADVYLHENNFDSAEEVLSRGLSAGGGADPAVQERLEDMQLRRAERQLAVAQQKLATESNNENRQLVSRLAAQANQVGLEIFAARADRDPANTRLKYELGVRLKRAGKFKDAITALQPARSDPKRRASVLIELGECFQRIEQYKLALSNYEQATEAVEELDSDILRLALYRAGVLSTGMREFDRAERALTRLAELDYGYRDVAERLDKLAELRNSG